MPSPADTPVVTFMVVVRNERMHIEKCLRSMLGQTLDHSRYEILVIDSMSRDGTREIVQRIIDEHPDRSIRMLDNPGLILSCGWNVGIREARGEYVIRPDAHTDIPDGFLAKSLAVMNANPEAAAVGGVIETRGWGFWGEIIAAVLSSRFGVGGSDFRVGAKPGPGNPIFALYKRSVLQEIGGLDESIPLNQDNICHARLRRAGHVLYLDPEIRCTYYCRSSLRALAKAMLRRSMWVVLMVRHTNDKVLENRYFVPLGFLLTLGGSAVGGLVWPPLLWVSAAIMSAYMACAYTIVRGGGLSFLQRLLIPVAALVLHLSYGVGSFFGCLRLPFYRPRGLSLAS